jgi:hypothetical protein
MVGLSHAYIGTGSGGNVRVIEAWSGTSLDSWVDSRSAGRSIVFKWCCFLWVDVEAGDARRRDKTPALRCTAKESPESLEERMTEACVDNVCALSERDRGPEHEVAEHWATLSRFRSVPVPEGTAEMAVLIDEA